MNLVLIAPAYFPTDEPYKLLRESCAHHHLPLVPFGQGQPWRGDTVAHFGGALETIRNLPVIYDLVMFTDAEDAFVLAGAEEIARKFSSYSCDYLMSAEQGLYPWGLEEQWAAKKVGDEIGPWQYPNGGGWIGHRDKLERLLVHAGSATGNEAQHKWISTYCSGDFSFRLDSSCLVFQTMSGDSSQHLLWKNHRALNKTTDSRPCVIHFNGRMGGIKDYYKEAYGG